MEERAGKVAVGHTAKTLPLAAPSVDAVPEEIPARMINELLYCERLMYLEWVQGEWSDNLYTIDGASVHRRVDRKDQVLRGRPASAQGANETTDGDERPYEARSVWLSSRTLGITAKVDVVEVDGGHVVPVEYKRGSCPERGPYLPEQAQVAAQVMLLREHGYECVGGEIYFAKDRRRVAVTVDDDLVDKVHEAVRHARELVLAGKLPAPLNDDPKCTGCSLAGICLPDEVKVLRQTIREEIDEWDPDALEIGEDPWGLCGAQELKAEAEHARRLFPARDDRVPVYVQGQGSSVRLSGERLIISRLGHNAVEVRMRNTSSLTLFGNVQITAQALRRLLEQGVPVLFATAAGWIVGRAHGADTKNVELRAAQYQVANDAAMCLRVASRMIETKIKNSRTLLRRNLKSTPGSCLGELKQLARKARAVESREALLGLEGAAARVYFRNFERMLSAKCLGAFDFARRTRRPPRDPVNALLSYCYTLLSRETVMACHACGLEPLVGLYHQPRFGRFSLALDLMEEFRPVLADSAVLSIINNGIVGADDFVRGNGAVAMKPAAKKRVIAAFERRMDQLVVHPVFDYRLSYRRVLEVQARLLTRVMLGELEEYPGFVVR